jgi:hypothetical protein
MTRTLFPFALVLLAAALGAGCSQERPPVFADAQWQVDCDSMMGMCSPALPRSVLGENGEVGTVTCNVVETADARSLSFYVRSTATDGTVFEAQLLGARVPRAGGSPTGGCTFTAGEGANRFTGACGASAPSTTQPCQVRMIEFGIDPMTTSTIVDVEVFCDHLPNAATAEQLRSVHFPSMAGAPAAFRFYDCVGLSRD